MTSSPGQNHNAIRGLRIVTSPAVFGRQRSSGDSVSSPSEVAMEAGKAPPVATPTACRDFDATCLLDSVKFVTSGSESVSAFTLSALIRADLGWHESCLNRVGKIPDSRKTSP